MTVGGTTPQEARELIADVWGEQAHVEPLAGDLDDNFLVGDPGAGRSVLKVMNPETRRERVDVQVAVLAHLAARGFTTGLPRVIPTRDGRDVASRPDRLGRPRTVWRLSWLDGPLLASVHPRPPALVADLGAWLGRLDRTLADFTHPGAATAHPWDPAAASGLRERVSVVEEPELRAALEAAVDGWHDDVEPRLDELPRQVIHGDANDHNVVVEAVPEPRRIVGLFDFGDLMHTLRVVEPAIAATYAAFGASDPLGAMARLVAAYHAEHPLTDAELDTVLPLVRARLAISLSASTARRSERPDDPYVTISERPARALLFALAPVHPRLAAASLRIACGRPATPSAHAVRDWLEAPERTFQPVLGEPLDPARCRALDLSVASELLGADPARLETPACGALIEAELARSGATVGVGRWNEPRAIYLRPAFAEGEHPLDEHRTVHLGVDLFVPAGTPVHVPLAGTVAAVADAAGEGDYGPVVLLEHRTGGDVPFWTLYGHLDRSVMGTLHEGRQVAAGTRIGAVGAPPHNGDWPPHLHLQLVLDPLDRGHDVAGVAALREREVRLALSPDPGRLAGLPLHLSEASATDADRMMAERHTRVGTGLRLSYRRPLHLVRGWRQYLWDEGGRAYLDLYNNVAHVGHSHPRVAEAVARQTALLATNTRYLHAHLAEYVGRLLDTLPDALEVGWIVNSASEANELALRLARAFTGRREVIVVEHGYHGHTTGLIDVSAYKFDGPGGEGRPPWVRTIPIPDGYRGRHRGPSDEALGRLYAGEVDEAVRSFAAEGRAPGAFLAETFPSVGGQVVPPPGWLPGVYRRVREAGGICIADEVQTGLGRLGDAFWGFELQGVVPDVVVVGKPAGNGFPLAAVLATREVADAFDTGMEFFSTFGGNPVACAAGLAVLDVIEEEGLQDRARVVGARLRAGLRELAAEWPLLGEVRGLGLFSGVQLVGDASSRSPAPRQARYVVERLRDEGFLTGSDGPDDDVLKLRGPLVVDEGDVDRFLARLAAVLGESPLRAM